MKNKFQQIFILVMLFVLISCCRTIKDYESLKNVPESQKKWVPPFLYDNEEIYSQIYNYYETHDLDTNETWGYFSINEKLVIPGDPNQLNVYVFFNKKKVEKRMKNLGCSVDINNGHIFQYGNCVFILLSDDKKRKYYFFGKYR